MQTVYQFLLCTFILFHILFPVVAVHDWPEWHVVPDYRETFVPLYTALVPLQKNPQTIQWPTRKRNKKRSNNKAQWKVSSIFSRQLTLHVHHTDQAVGSGWPWNPNPFKVNAAGAGETSWTKYVVNCVYIHVMLRVPLCAVQYLISDLRKVSIEKFVEG